jgi:hypothetical protein
MMNNHNNLRFVTVDLPITVTEYSFQTSFVIFSALALICVVGYGLWHNAQLDETATDIVNNLAVEANHLLVDCICPPVTHHHVADILVSNSDVSTDKQVNVSKLVNTCNAPIDVKEFWEVSSRSGFIIASVMECKNRFGCPDKSQANRLAVRRFLLDLMKQHKVRPTHINSCIDVCVELVFIPNNNDLAAREIARCFGAMRGGSQTSAWVTWARNCVFGTVGVRVPPSMF